MKQDPDGPPVACTLTTEQEAERSEEVHRSLISHYTGADDRPDGYVIRFDGADEALLAVANFTASELHCCAFAEYTIRVSPPYEETRLTITGSDGTKDVFANLVNRLETGAA